MVNEYDEILDSQGANEYDDVISGEKEAMKSKLKQSVFAASQGPDPERMAKSLEISKKTGLNPQTVVSSYDEISKNPITSENEYDDLINKNEKLATWLSDPNNSTVAKDDIQNLKKIDDSIKESSYGSDLLGSFISGAARLTSGLLKSPALSDPDAGLPLGMTEGVAYELDRYERKNAPVPKELYDNPVTRYFDAAAKKYAPPEMSVSPITAAMGGEYGKAAKALTFQIASNLPQLAVIVASRGAGLGVLALSSSGQKMADNVQAGKDSDVSRSNALVTGGIEAGIESIGGIGGIKSTVKQAAEKLGTQGAFDLVKSALWNIAKTSGEEGAEEFVTSIAQDLVDYSMDVNPDALNGILMRGLDALVVGAGSGGVTQSLIQGFTARSKAMSDAQAYQTIGNAVLESKLTTRSMDAQQSALTEMTQGTNVENVYIEPEAFETYFQSKGIPPSVAANDLGILDLYNEAKESGVEIKIKYADFIANTIKTEHYNGLANDIKFDPEELTVNQAKALSQELDQEAVKEKKPIDPRIQEINDIKTNVANQLKETGYSGRESSYIAQVHANLFDTFSRESGISPKELQAKYDLRILNSKYENNQMPANPDMLATPSSIDENGNLVLDTFNLDFMAAQIENGQAGERVLNQDGETVGIPSTFPPFFKDKGLKKAETLAIIKKHKEGKKLTERQAAILRDLYDSMVEQINRGEFFQSKKSYNQSISPLGFYSQVESEIEKMDFNQIPAKDLANRIKNIQGLKSEELETIGINEFLAAKEGKVTKQEVLDFVKNNGVQVEQIVLGGERGGDGGKFDWTDEKFVPLSQHDGNRYWEAVNDEVYNSRDDRQYDEERKAEIREQLLPEYTNENGDVDEAALDSAVETAREEEAQKSAEEYVDSEDYYSAVYVVEEKNSGWTLEGNDESGWYSPDTRKFYDGNIEEAKIKLAAAIAESEGFEYSTADLITAADITWGQVYNAKSPTQATLKKREKDLIKTKAAEYEAKAREEYPSEYDEKEYTKEEIEKNNQNNISHYARQEAEEYYKDPENPKNTVKVSIKNEGIEADIIGNNKKGFTFTVNDVEEKLEAKDLESAKKEAVEKLVADGVISPAPTMDKNDVNKSQGKAKWERYTMDGEKENYREFLLTLPGIKEKFQYKTHFDQENILAHVRVSDRVDENGNKVLFVEEIQSDWHQQGREKGYKTVDVDALRNERDEIENALENKTNLTAEQETELESKRKELTEQIIAQRDAVPNAPFKSTETWASLAMKRMIRLATEQGYQAIAWTPADVHVERWGTDSVSWVKREVKLEISHNTAQKQWTVIKEDQISGKPVDGGVFKYDGSNGSYEQESEAKAAAENFVKENSGTHWLVGSAEQSGGNADGVNIEALARQRGQLLERNGEKVTTKDELQNVVAETLGRERNDRSLETLTDRIWKRMQGEEADTGAVMPRKEGMEFFYNKMIPDVTKKILKKLDPAAKIEVAKIDDTQVLEVKITPEMQAKAQEGFTLFQGDENAPRGQIVFGKDRKFNIHLFESSDLSTPLHESAHFFFEVMGDLAELPESSQQLKDDFQALLNYAGVESRDQVGVEQHEKIAEAFEAYIMEGKSPSSKLRKAFAAFKVWLTAIYKQIKPIVEIPDNVKSVFDRMLATQEEIDSAQAELRQEPLFTNPKEIGLSDKDTLDYFAAITEAREEAKEILNRQLMADFHEQETKFYKEKRKQISNEVEQRLKNSRRYKTLETLQNGTLEDGGQFKILKSSVKGLEGLARGITSTDGIHVEIAASILGYADGTALINDMTNVPSIKDAVKSETDAIMAEAYPDSLTDGTISERAIEAVHNDKQADLKLMELEILSKQKPALVKNIVRRIVKRVPSKKAVRDQAVKSIGKLSVKEIKPNIYKLAEIKAAKDAGIALAAGDIDAAFLAKRKELLNHELFRAATEAKAIIKNDIKFFKKLNKSDEELAKTRDTDYVNAARAILAEFGITRTDKSADEYLEKTKMYDPDTYGTIMALVNSATENAGPYQSVPFNEFVAMSDSVKALWDLSRSTRQIEIDGKKIDREQVQLELENRINEISASNKKFTYEGSLTTGEEANIFFLSLRSALRRVEHWALAVNGPAREFTNYIWNPISESVNRYRAAREIVMKQYRDTFRILDRNSLDRGEILAPELNSKFKNKSEIVGALLHIGNESNLTKLLVGRGWGTLNEDGSLNRQAWDSFINRMHREGVLTKADYDWAQAIWDLNETLKPQAQKAHKEMYGYYFNEITANEFETPFGIYRGGYVPAAVDPNRSETKTMQNEKEILEQGQNSYMYPTTGRGFTKSRTEHYHAPLSIDIDLVGMHIDASLRFIHIEPYVKQVARIVTNEGFRQTMGKYDPTAVGEMLIPWLQRSATQRISTPTGNGRSWKRMDAMASWLRSSVGMNVMSFNVTNVLQNYTGIAVAAVKVPPRLLRNATWDYIKNSKMMAEAISQKSVFMDNELNSNMDEYRKEIDKIIVNETAIQKAAGFARSNAYILQKLSQSQNNIIIWSAAYAQAVERGDTEKESIRYADETVRTTQSSLKAEDVSRYETGSPVLLLFSQFYGYFNNLANFNATEYINVTRDMGLRKGAGRLAVLFLAANFLPAITAEAIRLAMNGKGLDADDDDEYLDDAMGVFFGAPAKYLSAQVPLAAPIGQLFFNSWNDNSYDDRLSVAPVISVVESSVKSASEVYAAIDNENMENRAVKDSLTALGIMTATPLGAIARPLNYLNDYRKGNAEPTGPLDFSRGLVTGKAGQRNDY